jgi:hypothetical protein
VGIRESLNRTPRLSKGILAGIILVALIYLLWSRAGGESGGGRSGTQAYFSTDDGKTWFADDAKKIPPFVKSGKDAVRVYVYQCPDGKKFASHLERYTPEAKKALEASHASRSRNIDLNALQRIQTSGVEVKAPGQGDWVKSSDPKAAAIVRAKCPQGGGEPEPLEP